MGFWLLPPFFLIRFGLLSRLSGEAVQRAAFFAPLLETEKAAYWLYQLSNAAIMVSLFFLKIQRSPTTLFFTGLAVYLLGLVLLAASVASFAAPATGGMNQSGLYRFSRNPMYVAYFVFFMGCVLLTQSLVLLAFVLLFQITARVIIRSEERWCIQKFGEEYRQYMQRVGRYGGFCPRKKEEHRGVRTWMKK